MGKKQTSTAHLPRRTFTPEEFHVWLARWMNGSATMAEIYNRAPAAWELGTIDDAIVALLRQGSLGVCSRRFYLRGLG